MRTTIPLVTLMFFGLLLASHAQTGRTKSAVNAAFRDTSRSQVNKEQRCALIIANSKYNDPRWDTLPHLKYEVVRLMDSLYRLGFDTVIIRKDRTQSQMDGDVKSFIAQYGKKEQNSILIYYTGHGLVTYRRQKEQGFVVPVDAPFFLPDANIDKRDDPVTSEDMQEYRSKQDSFENQAISYEYWKAYASDVSARHALFIFDCCFSGLSCAKKSRIPIPLLQLASQNKSVDFLTAGDIQVVPGESLFLKFFLRAISGTDRSADHTPDGFLLTSELYLYLKKNVQEATEYKNTPRYCWFYEDDERGEFVFPLPGNKSTSDSDIIFRSDPDAVQLQKKDVAAYRIKTLSWFGGCALSAGIGGWLINAANKNYDQYQTATNGATDLHRKIQTQQIAAYSLFGFSGLCAVLTIINGVKLSHAKSKLKLLEFSAFPVRGGGWAELKINTDFFTAKR